MKEINKVGDKYNELYESNQEQKNLIEAFKKLNNKDLIDRIKIEEKKIKKDKERGLD